MTPWRKLARLTRNEQALLLRAGAILAAIRIALWVLPWSSLIHLLRKRRFNPGYAKFAPIRLAWAVRNASRVIPGATCLTQALGLHYFLSRCGHPSRVEIGVAKNEESGFQAHAWVESNGAILLDPYRKVALYSRLLTLEVAPRNY